MKDIIFKTLMLKGEAGSTIVSMERTGHSGTTDTYTITFDDGSTTDIQIENLSSVESIELTSQTDTEDTYTATLADGSTQSFSVLNHNADIEAISEELAAGLASIAADLADQAALLSARMDEFTSLPSGSTAGDAELMDIRVGADGTIYDSAGSAVRGQISDLKNDLNKVIAPYIDEDVDFSIEGSFTNYSNGTFATGQGADNKRTDYIDLTNIGKINYCVEGYSTVIATIAFYDSSKNYLQSISKNSGGYENRTIDLSEAQYADAKYVVISSHGWTSAHGSEIFAKVIKKQSLDELFDTVDALVPKAESAEFISGVSWSLLPMSILEKMEFLGVTPENEPYASFSFSIQNLVGAGSFTSYKHSTSGDRYLTASSLSLTNTELNWNKAISIHALCDFDYDGVFVLYDKRFDPYHIKMIGIAKSGATFTDAEKDVLGNVFKLSAFREGYYRTSGVIKYERPLWKKSYENLIQNPTFSSNADWTLGSAWSISGGMAVCNDTSITRSTLSQTVTLVGGNDYRIGFKLDAVTSGSVELYIDEELISDAVSVNVYYEYPYTPSGSGNVQKEVSFKPTSGNAFKGKISFVELTEI